MLTTEVAAPTVLATRPVSDWTAVEGEVVRSSARVAELLLGLVRETAAARGDHRRLLEVIADFAFRAFPNATHHALVSRDAVSGEWQPMLSRSRSGESPPIALSRTILTRAAEEGCAILFTHTTSGSLSAARSVALSGLETAICAPLCGRDSVFGAIQLDIRRPGRGIFSREDVDLLSVFASQVGLTLENLAMYEQQKHALQSTINALVHSLTLKDPEAARHSERVQAVSLAIGEDLSLDGTAMEILSVAAILHDLGKQGIRDEVLFKPDRLTDDERDEMAQHAAHTQTILDKIEYPEELREVPRIAAYHHEKLDGTGPFGVAGDDIPIQARIISVADVFDALLSPRVYKEPLGPHAVLEILARGMSIDWDERCVQALRHVAPTLLVELYGRDAADVAKLFAPPEDGDATDPGASAPDAPPLDRAA